jgi:hypothetical protein
MWPLLVELIEMDTGKQVKMLDFVTRHGRKSTG